MDLRSAVAAAIGVGLAIAIQSLWVPLDADVSWLITVSERVLSGDRLYVDIFEVNPPASVWLYMPTVWIAGLLGARPELLVAAAFVVGALTSVYATVRFASRLDNMPRRHWLASALLFVALVLPMGLFAQREHAALLLSLPVLAGLAIIAADKPLSRQALCGYGIAAGLIVVIKPHFFLAVTLPGVWAAWRRRSLSPLLPAIATASVPPIVYAIAVAVLMPTYFDWLLVLVHTYLPMRAETWRILIGCLMFPAASLVLAALMRPRPSSPLVTSWALGSAGFTLAAIAQWKGYPNHWLPGAALALLALVTMVSLPHVARSTRTAVGAWVGAIALVALYSFTIRPDPVVAAAVERAAPPAPSIIALSTQLSVGHPVTRNVGGRWVGSRAALFTAAGARRNRFSDSVASQAYADDIHAFVTDVKRHSPDVVLVDQSSNTWLMREPAIAGAMAAYERAAVANQTEVWLRRRVATQN